MMDDVLKRLADLPLPVGLDRLDDAILAGLAARQGEERATSRLLSAAAVLALGVGYAGGSILPTPATAADHRLVITETALAPSTLLDFL
jgi:hypothetical protein